MAQKSIFIIAITLISSQLSQQQQNLCGTDGTRVWVNDASNCHNYLWCNWDRTATPPTLTSVHQLDCRDQGSNHFRPDDDGTAGVCTENFADCVADPLSMCPPASENEIMVANPDDPECREHRPCRLTDANWNTCRDPLVFNRHSGTCDFADRAPCGGASSSLPDSPCSPGVTENVAGDTCYSFILCIEGEVAGTFNCGPGLLFDAAAKQCIQDLENICPRTFEIQRVKNVYTLKNSGFNKFLRAIHLN